MRLMNNRHNYFQTIKRTSFTETISKQSKQQVSWIMKLSYTQWDCFSYLLLVLVEELLNLGSELAKKSNRSCRSQSRSVIVPDIWWVMYESVGVEFDFGNSQGTPGFKWFRLRRARSENFSRSANIRIDAWSMHISFNILSYIFIAYQVELTINFFLHIGYGNSTQQLFQPNKCREMNESKNLTIKSWKKMKLSSKNN